MRGLVSQRDAVALSTIWSVRTSQRVDFTDLQTYRGKSEEGIYLQQRMRVQM
jgi:hypothetical protein